MTTVNVLILTQEQCAFCASAKALFDRLGTEYPLAVSLLPIESAEGQDLARRGQILFAPGIFIDGEAFSYGRPSERRIRRALELRRATSLRHGRPGAVAATGLWVFMGVATMLFSLFSLAYVLRLEGVAGYPLALPWQLWLSTALLAIGGIALQRSSATAHGGHLSETHVLLLAGGACAFAFLGVQLWAWSEMKAARVTLTGNPAGTFFYLLTAMHGLHVAGGLVAWVLTARKVWTHADPAGVAWRITLCARYWHFLLIVWAVLFAMMALLTPEAVRIISSPL